MREVLDHPTVPSPPIRFTMAAPDVRRELYSRCEVHEPVLNGEPIYLCVCRHCRRVVALVPRVAEDIDAAPVLALIAHVDACKAAPCTPLESEP